MTQAIGIPRTRPSQVTGDMVDIYPRIEALVRCHAIGADMPQRSDQLTRHKGRPLSSWSRYLLPAQRDCELPQLAEGVQVCRDVLREAGVGLLGDAQAGNHTVVSASGVFRQSPGGRRP